MRGGEGRSRETAGTQRAARVEAEPAEPEQSRAEDRERQVVGRRGFGVTLALAKDERGSERRGTRVDVHHGTAGEVESAQFPQHAADSPYPVRHGVVDDRGPQKREDEERAELHALGERADDEGGCDDGEHHLEEHEQHVGDRALRSRRWARRPPR